MIAHLGGGANVSITQRLLISRLIKTIIQADLFEKKLAAGSWTGLDQRTYNALLNSIRLTAQTLGLKPAAPDHAAILQAHIDRVTKQAKAEREAAP